MRLASLSTRLTAALRPLEEIATAPRSFADIAARHRDALAELSADASGTPAAFAGFDGEALAAAFDEIALDPTSAGFALQASDYAELFRTGDRRSHRAPAGAAGRAGAHLRPARSAPAERRSRRARRSGRGHLAAGDPPGPVAQPADAARARARSAGAAHLAVGARLRAGAGRERSDPQLSGQACGRADGGVALRAAARRGGGRDALERLCASSGAQYLAWARALDHARRGRAHRQARAEAAARRAAYVAVGDRDRDLAARSLHHLRQAHPAGCASSTPIDLPPGAADRGTSSTARSATSPRPSRPALPDDPEAALLEIGAQSTSPRSKTTRRRSAFWWPRFRRIARWFAGWERARRHVVAHAARRESAARSTIPLGERVFTLRGARRPHRAAGRRPLRDPRLQDRHGADREAGAHRHVAAAHPRSRDAARRRLSTASPPARRSPSLPMWRCAAASRRAKSSRSSSRTATPNRMPTARSGKLKELVDTIRGRAAALPAAGAVDVEEPLRHLRSPRARQGMVGRRGRGRVVTERAAQRGIAGAGG